jgi:hypothetical protein
MGLVLKELGAHFQKEIPKGLFAADLRENFLFAQVYFFSEEGNQGFGQSVPFGSKLGNLFMEAVPFVLHFVQGVPPTLRELRC